MAKDYEFLSGELWAVQSVMGLIPPVSWAAAPKHLALRAMFQFTEAEQAKVGWYENLGPPGQPDTTGFTETELPLTRKLTPSMRKKMAEVIQQATSQLSPAYFERWLVPVLETIGHAMPAAVWEDEEDETEPEP